MNILNIGISKMQAEATQKAATEAAIAATTQSITQAKKTKGYLYNAEKALLRFNAEKAKAAAQGKLINLNVYGSSSVLGQGSNGGGQAGNLVYTKEKQDTGFCGRFRTKVNKKYGNTGKGIVPWWYGGWYTFAGTWKQNGTLGGLMRQSCNRGEGTGTKFTTTFSGTGFSILALQEAAGAKFTITINNGTPEEFNTTHATLTTVKEFKHSGKFDVGSNTAVVEITDTNAANGLAFIGAIDHGEVNYGIRVNQIAVGGSLTDQVIGPERNQLTTIDYWKPALSVIAYVSNDFGNQTPIADFKSQTRQIIRRCQNFGDVLLAPAGMRADDKTIKTEEYLKVYRDLADEFNCAYYDTYARYDHNYATMNTVQQFVASDGLHMNDYGHQDLADGLFEALF